MLGNWKNCCSHGGRDRTPWLLRMLVRNIAHICFIQAVCISVLTEEKFDLIGKRKGPPGSRMTAFSNGFQLPKEAGLFCELCCWSSRKPLVFAYSVGVLYNSVMLSQNLKLS